MATPEASTKIELPAPSLEDFEKLETRKKEMITIHNRLYQWALLEKTVKPSQDCELIPLLKEQMWLQTLPYEMDTIVIVTTPIISEHGMVYVAFDSNGHDYVCGHLHEANAYMERAIFNYKNAVAVDGLGAALQNATRIGGLEGVRPHHVGTLLNEVTGNIQAIIQPTGMKVNPPTFR